MEQNILAIITVILFLPTAIRKIFLYSYWWQVKEYRWDRMLVFWGMREGKKVFFPYYFSLKIFLIISFLFNPLVIFLGLFIFLIEDIFHLIEILRRRVRRPVLTLRGWELVITGAVMAVGGGILILQTGGFGGILIAIITDISLLFFPLVAVAWTAPFVNMAKTKEIIRAKKILADVKPIIVGITGSYGKTSTKEITAAILSEKFKVAKTEGSENTEFGIARKIQQDIKSDTQIFVCEMGAYKKGEIKKLCDIIKPKVGVITAIGNQHLALFGSQENIKRAKYEIIEALPEDGIAVFNGNNKICLDLALKEKKNTVVYTTQKLKVQSDKQSLALRAKLKVVYGKDIKVNKNSVSFQLMAGGKDIHVTVPLLGGHFVQNILGAMGVGIALGMTPQQIALGAAKIKPIPRTMQPLKGPNDSLVVDDSYSASFDGFLAALAWLKKVNGRKTVITPGIIELGELSESKHQELGQVMRGVVDNVFLTNDDFAEPLGDGLGKNKAKLKVVNMNDIDKFISNLGKNDIVLIEGRIPERMRQKLV